MARIFVTGGAGFIGTSLCLRLASAGHEVTSYDSYLPQVHMPGFPTIAALRAAGVTTLEGDIRNAETLGVALSRATPEVIFHFAAETGTGQSYDEPVRYVDVNVTGTAILIEAVRRVAPQVRRIIMAGTRAVYGEGACVDAAGRTATPVARTQGDMARGDFRIKDASGMALMPVPTRADLCPANTASVYASSKLMQEHLLVQGFWGTQTGVTVLRLQNVYGPGQSSQNPYTGVLSVFADTIAKGGAPVIFEDGEITRDFVFVGDVARAFEMAGTTQADTPQVLDIGSGQGATIHQTGEALMQIAGTDPARISVNGFFRPGDVRHAVADISKAQTALGWHPETPLQSGLWQLWQWRQHGNPDT